MEQLEKGGLCDLGGELTRDSNRTRGLSPGFPLRHTSSPEDKAKTRPDVGPYEVRVPSRQAVTDRVPSWDRTQACVGQQRSFQRGRSGSPRL